MLEAATRAGGGGHGALQLACGSGTACNGPACCDSMELLNFDVQVKGIVGIVLDVSFGVSRDASDLPVVCLSFQGDVFLLGILSIPLTLLISLYQIKFNLTSNPNPD
jgi:hypothetical protein